MTNLREAAKTAKGEIWQLERIELDSVEVKDKKFKKTETIDGKVVSREVDYKVLVVSGREYTIRDKQLSQIKEQLEKKPTLKAIRFMKFDDGKVNCIPLE